MDITVLKQYTSLCEERRDIEKRISKTMMQLEEAKSTIVEDIVKGSSKHFPYVSSNMHVAGVDEGLVKRKLKALNRLKGLHEEKKIEIMEKEADVEEFLKSVDDSWLRQIIRYKVIDRLTWTAVGMRMKTNGDACRKQFERYINMSEMSN
ncbi:MAG: hypothetical protein Q4F05_11325 [bacterium]|nr:hypothetical protein [bacterium]